MFAVLTRDSQPETQDSRHRTILLSIVQGLQQTRLKTLKSIPVLPSTENFVKQFSVTLEVFQHFHGGESRGDSFDQPRLRRCNIDPVGNPVHAPDEFLTALGQHEIDEESRGIRMRRFGGNSRRVNIGEDRI